MSKDSVSPSDSKGAPHYPALALLGPPAVVGLLERNQGSVEIAPKLAAPALRTFGVRLPSRLVRRMVPATEAFVNRRRRYRFREVTAEQEHRKQIEHSFVIETFAAEASRSDGFCPVHEEDSAKCGKRHEADWQHAVRQAETRSHERQAELRQHTAEATAAFYDETEESAVRAYGRTELARQQQIYAAIEARLRRRSEKLADRCAKVQAQVGNLAGRTSGEQAALVDQLAALKQKRAAVARALAQVAAWRLLFLRAEGRAILAAADQRRQATPASPRACLVCERPVREEESFDSDICARRWQSVGLRDGGQSWGRVCLTCNRWFRSAAPAVLIVADDFLFNSHAPRLLQADVCSVACWAQVAAVAPEPPDFSDVRYVGPPPQIVQAAAPRGGAGNKSESPGEAALLAALRRIREEVGPSLTPRELLLALRGQGVSIPNTTRLAQVMADVGLRTKHRKAGKSTSRSYDLDNLPADGETS